MAGEINRSGGVGGGASASMFWQLYLISKGAKNVQISDDLKNISINGQKIAGVDLSDGLQKDELSKMHLRWENGGLEDIINKGMLVDGKAEDSSISTEEITKYYETVQKWAMLKYHHLIGSGKTTEAMLAAASDYAKEGQKFSNNDLDGAIQAAQKKVSQISQTYGQNLANMTVKDFVEINENGEPVFALKFQALLIQQSIRVFNKKPTDKLGDKELAVAEELCYHEQYLALTGGAWAVEPDSGAFGASRTGDERYANDTSPTLFKIGDRVVRSREFNDKLQEIQDREFPKDPRKPEGEKIKFSEKYPTKKEQKKQLVLSYFSKEFSDMQSGFSKELAPLLMKYKDQVTEKQINDFYKQRYGMSPEKVKELLEATPEAVLEVAMGLLEKPGGLLLSAEDKKEFAEINRRFEAEVKKLAKGIEFADTAEGRALKAEIGAEIEALLKNTGKMGAGEAGNRPVNSIFDEDKSDTSPVLFTLKDLKFTKKKYDTLLERNKELVIRGISTDLKALLGDMPPKSQKFNLLKMVVEQEAFRRMANKLTPEQIKKGLKELTLKEPSADEVERIKQNEEEKINLVFRLVQEGVKEFQDEYKKIKLEVYNDLKFDTPEGKEFLADISDQIENEKKVLSGTKPGVKPAEKATSPSIPTSPSPTPAAPSPTPATGPGSNPSPMPQPAPSPSGGTSSQPNPPVQPAPAPSPTAVVPAPTPGGASILQYTDKIPPSYVPDVNVVPELGGFFNGLLTANNYPTNQGLNLAQAFDFYAQQTKTNTAAIPPGFEKFKDELNSLVKKPVSVDIWNNQGQQSNYDVLLKKYNELSKKNATSAPAAT